MSHYTIREVDATYPLPDLGTPIPAQQAFFYGTWHEKLGRHVYRFVIEKESNPIGVLQLVAVPLVYKYSLLYAPYGPVLMETTRELIGEIARVVSHVAKKEKAVFTRLDFTAPAPASDTIFADSGFRHPHPSALHGSAFQPTYEWALDLSPSLDGLRANMNKKHRYSLRVSEEQHVTTRTICTGTRDYLAQFFALIEETAERDGFTAHPRAYYEAVFDSLEQGHGYLTIADFNNEIAVINVIVAHTGVAYLLFSGSRGVYRHTMATYAAQWASILQAKHMGLHTYNFGGIAGTGDNRYAGITRYKKRFGGYPMSHEMTVDLVHYPLLYALYSFRRRLKS